MLSLKKKEWVWPGGNQVGNELANTCWLVYKSPGLSWIWGCECPAKDDCQWANYSETQDNCLLSIFLWTFQHIFSFHAFKDPPQSTAKQQQNMRLPTQLLLSWSRSVKNIDRFESIHPKMRQESRTRTICFTLICLHNLSTALHHDTKK